MSGAGRAPAEREEGMRKQWSRGAAVFLACALVVACGKEKRMAEAALKSAEITVASAGDDVAKFAPELWKQITDSLAAAKDAYARKDYKAALASLQDIAPKVQEAEGLASAKKTELEAAWTQLGAGVTKMVEAIQSRVDVLSASRKLHAGMDKAKLDAAKSGLASAAQTWSEATAAHTSGNLADAVAKANAVKDSATKLMQDLGMSLPAAVGGGT